MKYVAEFSIFDSALVSQGDLLSLSEDGRRVNGYAGVERHHTDIQEVLAISKNMSKLSQNDDGTFWATVTLDSETGEVTCSDLYRYRCGGNGYGHAEPVKEVAHA